MKDFKNKEQQQMKERDSSNIRAKCLKIQGKTEKKLENLMIGMIYIYTKILSINEKVKQFNLNS